jgi:hypothetical protein
MAVYKVIQDVEAEDKLLGPLTFKAFIYALITGVCAFIEFRLFILGSPIKWLFIFAFALPMILFGVLASPLGHDQPTEVWLLSRIRFFLKPRERIWDQEGLEELVTITVPKKIEEHLAKDISQTEVHSRLKTLATTLDTRGWAIKNVDLNLNDQGLVRPNAAASDRLVPNAGYAQPAQVIDVHAADDILDEQNNPTAQKFASMMQDADEKRKKEVLQTMKGLINESDHPTKKTAKKHSSAHKKSPQKNAKSDATNVDNRIDKKTTDQATTAPVTPERQAVNMELAQSGSAFSVATLSQLANRQPQIEQTGPNEVIISLH